MSTSDGGFHGNWSELPEPYGAGGLGYDCGYGTALTCITGCGFNKFPLGAYTVAEREELERSDYRKDETGATIPDVDIALFRRYGIEMHPLADADLPAALRKPGAFVHVQGVGYGGGHSYAVQTGGDSLDRVRKFDPMKPMFDAGELVSVASVVDNHRQLGAGALLRIAYVGEFAAPAAPEADMDPLVIPDTLCAVAPGPLYSDGDCKVEVLHAFTGSTGVGTYGPRGASRALRIVWGRTADTARVCYVPAARCSNIRPRDAAAVQAAVKAAVTPLNKAIETAAAALAAVRQ